MAPISHVKILEQHYVSPPPSSAPPPPPLPLTYFDIPWLFFSPSQPLFFYDFPFSTSHFTTTILLTLKHSLSLTLQHFYPLAGNLSLPPNPASKPHFVFSTTDSVLLTLAESTADLTHLTANHPRDAQQFHPLVPPLPQDNDVIVPLLSVQLTLFPNSAGVCIGLAFQRAVADERTFNHFLKSWASICRQKLEFKSSVRIINPLPSFDRAPILDPMGLEPIFLEQLWRLKSSPKRGLIQGNMVRATFVLSLSDMERVKTWIITRCNVINLSSYVLTCSFIWVCLIRAQEGTKSQTNPKNVDDKKAVYFGFIAGGITRLKFPVPTSYFGNCIAFGRCTAQRNELLGEDGIIVAAKAVADTIEELNGDVLGGAERWVLDWEELLGREEYDQLHVMVVGSPKVDLYGTDFGWGRPKKIEQVSIDGRMRAISFTESRDLKGGIEVGLVLPQPQMLAFTSLFNDGSRALL